MGNWESFEFNPHAVVGVSLHKCLENYNKENTYKQDEELALMEREFKLNNQETKTDKYDFIEKFQTGIRSIKELWLKKPNQSELEIKVTIKWTNYWLKGKIDALYTEYGLDYKFVSETSSAEKAQEKYWFQAMFYMYLIYKKTLQKLDWRILEISTEDWWVRWHQFKRDESIIQQIEDTTRKCIIKAERLRSLQLKDVL